MRVRAIFAIAVVIGFSAPGVSPAQDLLLHFPLDSVEGNGLQVIRDDGAKDPAPMSGASGNALNFVGRSAVALPFNLDHAQYPQITMTAWVKESEGARGSRTVVGTPGGMQLSVNGGRVSVRAGRTGVSLQGATVPADEWVFIAAVVDTEAGWARLHQNDQVYFKEGLDTTFREPVALVDPNNKDSEPVPWVVVGARRFVPWQRYERPMGIDEVRVYAGLLSEESIQAMARPGSPTDPQSLPGDMYDGDGTDPNALPGDMYDGDGTDPNALPGDMYDGDGTDPNALPGDMYDPPPEGTPTPPVGGVEGAVGDRIAGDQPDVVNPDLLPGGAPAGGDASGDSAADVISGIAGDLTDTVDPDAIQDDVAPERPPMEYDSEEEGEAAAAAAEERRAREAAEEEAANQPDPTERQPLVSSDAIRFTGLESFSQVAGHSSTIRRQLDLVDAFLNTIDWFEDSDRPCRIEVSGELDNGSGRSMDECGSGSVFGAFSGSRKTVRMRVNGEPTPIQALQVCNNDRSNRRLKGIRILAGSVDALGRVNQLPDVDTESRPNCSTWSNIVSCGANQLATGILVHSSEAGVLSNAEQITGLQLICREVTIDN